MSVLHERVVRRGCGHFELSIPEAVHADFAEEAASLCRISSKDLLFVVKVLFKDETEGLFVQWDALVPEIALDGTTGDAYEDDGVDDPVREGCPGVFLF